MTHETKCRTFVKPVGTSGGATSGGATSSGGSGGSVEPTVRDAAPAHRRIDAGSDAASCETCVPNACTLEDRAPAYSPGMVVTGSTVKLTLLSSVPAPRVSATTTGTCW